MSLQEISSCCQSLYSKKITERKRSAECLLELLGKENVVSLLNTSESVSWDNVVEAVHHYFIKEGERLWEKELKNKTTNAVPSKVEIADILIRVVKVANKGKVKIKATVLIKLFIACFQCSNLKRYFGNSYLVILKDLLSEQEYHGNVKSEEWLDLLHLLKSLYQKPSPGLDKQRCLECLLLVVQWGPLNGFPALDFRREFIFVIKLCKQIDSSCPRYTQECVLQILLYFCKHTAKDCQLTCCKLGENVMGHIMKLYDSTACDNTVKLLLFEFLLLQVNIHHPKGAAAASAASCAFSWHEWNKQIHSVYLLLCSEINKNLNIKYKKSTLFVTSKNVKIIHYLLVNLFVDVFKQVSTNKNCDISMTNIFGNNLVNDSQPPSKKQRIEISISSIINIIQDTRDWPWINILHCLLKKYPDIITENDFIFMLQTLSSIQVECSDSNIQHHIYECLSVMVDAQKSLFYNFVDPAAVSSLWAVVWESTVRATGLNQNEEQTNNLLQKLIINEKPLLVTPLFRTYFSGVINVTECSVRTLDVACYYYGLPEENISEKNKCARDILTKWLLCFESDKSFNVQTLCQPITAKVLTSLTLKQWPLNYNIIFNVNQYYESNHENIQQIYLKTAFDSELLCDENSVFECDDTTKTYSPNLEALDKLYTTLKSTIDYVFSINLSKYEQIKHLVCLSVLLTNVISYMVDYNITSQNELENFVLTALVKDVFEKICEDFETITTKINENKIDDVSEILNLFKTLFTTIRNTHVVKLVRELLPLPILKRLFVLLRNKETDTNNEGEKQLRKLYLEVLSNYSCSPELNELTRNQKFALETLANPSIDCGYEENMVFLNILQKCKPGTLSDQIIYMVLEGIRSICVSHYTVNSTMFKVLKISNDLFPHISLSKSNDIKETSLKLLYMIYERYKNYCTDVSVSLLNCFGRVIQLSNAEWQESVDTAKILPNFLCSELQEIRLAAIESLSALFSISCENKKIYCNQKEMFESLVEISSKILELEVTADESSSTEDILIEERIKDETTTRSATVIHMYSVIMVVSHLWRQKAFFALLQICEKRKLIHSELLIKALELVARKLNFANKVSLFEAHLKYLIENYRLKCDLKSFPYFLLEIDSLMKFYSKYKSIVVPYLVQYGTMKELEEFCLYLNRTVVDIVEESHPNIMASCLPAFACEETFIMNISKEELNDKKTAYKNLVNVLGVEKLSELLHIKVDQVLLNLVKLIFDTEHFEKLFNVKSYFWESDSSYLKVNALQAIVKYIERKISNGQALMEYCIFNYPHKIQCILLCLKTNIYIAATIETKLLEFHRYCIIVNMIVPFLKTKNSLQEFVIRDVCFTLMNLISTNLHAFTTLDILAVKYLKIVLKEILPECSDILKKHLLVIVSVLTPIAKCENDIGTESINLLNLLIVDNAVYLSSAIEALDPFPSDKKFEVLQETYRKYQNKNKSLEYQITHFLNVGKLILSNIGCRIEGLKNLKEVLSDNKEELKNLYSDLYKIKGFSEDCQKSILHQLVCMLVKLTYFEDTNIMLEATKCLGELGAADLTTLVLQTEPIQDGLRCGNSLELMTGCIISLLSQFLIDPNIEVVKTSSAAMYHVMNSKEAKIALDSQKDYGFGIIDKSYLTPFMPAVGIKTNLNVNIQTELFEKEIHSELWCSSESNSHDKWVTNLVCSLLKCFNDKSYLNQLIPVCRVKTSLCEKLLPLLIYVLLYTNSKKITPIISRNMTDFFSKHWNLRQLSTNSQEVHICINKASTQCLLNVINFIRLQNNLSPKKKAADLKLNYLEVAYAAQFCSAHFTALLYVELWCEEKISEIRSAQSENMGLSKLDLLFQTQDPLFIGTLQNILKEAYKAIGDFDALKGCGLSHLLDMQSRIEHYKQQGRWGQVTQFFEVEVAHGKSEAFSDLMHSLNKSCLYQLPILCTNTNSEPDYECLWRLGKWNSVYVQNPQTSHMQKENNFEKLKYVALKSLFDDSQYVFVDAIKNARYSVVNNLKHASLESSKNLYSYLLQLQSLQEIEDIAIAKTTDNFKALFEKWNLQDCINPNDFQYIEPIRAQRISVINGLLKQSHEDHLQKALIEFSLDTSGLARLEGDLNVANRVMACLSQINVTKPEIKARIMYEEAQLCWANNDKTTGRYLLKHLIDGQNTTSRLLCSALKLYGTWMIETHSENSNDIIMNYFLRSLGISSNMKRTSKDEEIRSETFDVFAKFTDTKYQQVVSYIDSSVFEQKVKNIKKCRQAAEELSKTEKTIDVKKALIVYQKQNVIDENELNSTYKEKDVYLKLSIKYYTANLECSDLHNENIFRVISLWLENRNNTQLAELLRGKLPRIPSYKYVTILPQLIPHLTNNEEDNFGKEIGSVVERCAVEHLHHTLPIILALANSNKDRLYSKNDTNTASNETRVGGANILLEKLKNHHKFENLINKMEKLAEALIELAYFKDKADVSNKNNSGRIIPEGKKIRKIKNYDDVLLPTYNLPINKSGNYSNIIGISSFDNKYNNVGGINAPKRITCRGTDGITRTQLVKGQDDLRQDAVMQQVFTIMNRLLANSKQTNKLLIRTYKVVPLSMRSGILEWVDNSIPIGEYLIGDDGAHIKYGRVADYSPSKCRSLFKSAADKRTVEDKLVIYKTICDNFKPVFHKFFETSFPQATVWYERRQAYVHSVATSSMCGYILGLGDRHVQNILLDKRSCEVIHIDFGIAFEQGRVLPTPETVPFRLTRDMEDGMGVAGVEGVFRRSCEKTMEVLRHNAQTIITILEVLLYDPLYAWTVSAADAYNRQHDEENDMAVNFSDAESVPVNVTAKRALLRLRNKLHGTEEGIFSVESQVEKLIQEARDPANLCRLFHGWQPYL